MEPEKKVSPTTTTKKSKWTIPHIYVLLFMISGLSAILTYIIPAGSFERVDGPNGRESIDPNSFTEIEASPLSFMDFMLAIPRGMSDASEIIFFTFIIGGMFMVLRRTEIIEIGVDRLARKFKKQSILIIPVLITVFAAVATTIGTPELALVYIPVLIPLCVSLGYDSMTATAIALISTVLGFTAGVMNPGTVGISQQIAGLETYSGFGLRVLVLIIIVGIGSMYVMRYARRVKKRPKDSFTFDEDEQKRLTYKDALKQPAKQMNQRQFIAMATLPIFFAILIFGVTQLGWFMLEMSGLFIFMGIIVGFIAGLSLTKICEAFTEGFREVLMGAIIIGIARSVAIVLEDGQIMDSIVYGLGSVVGHLPSTLSAIGMMVVQLVINFFIPSGSGQALVTMPIMAPLSDLVGVTRQTAILAFQFGDGFANILFPTSGYFMAALVVAGVSWSKWIKFFLPLFLIYMGVGTVFLIYAQVTGWTG
ncbi:YfcC family protein [Alkalicoccobacillus porphyridii]|uniref:YfcC family protein n=1 Tax=Alkalicoccobacillus porphyridii TaxID=2597270 RepID=A0A554A412_9BACI|nr:TIGR00366 family protein [Alkalicoccobacillus porphyridii]TSB48408.1 YfcC family protein [Alkalicoccobacillus porphyridii]